MLYDQFGKPIRSKTEETTSRLLEMAAKSLLKFSEKKSFPWAPLLVDQSGKPISSKEGGTTIKFRRYQKMEGTHATNQD
jgi:hypothetical protein